MPMQIIPITTTKFNNTISTNTNTKAKYYNTNSHDFVKLRYSMNIEVKSEKIFWSHHLCQLSYDLVSSDFGIRISSNCVIKLGCRHWYVH